MLNITMNLNIFLCGAASLIFGFYSPVVISTDNQTNPIIQSINNEIKHPCGGTANLAKYNCTGTMVDSNAVQTFMRLTRNLQRRVKSRYVNYVTRNFSEICGNEEYMNAAKTNIENNNFCEIPSSLTEVDMSQSSQNMLLVTKWLFWLKEVEEKRYQQNSMHDFRQSFYSLANYSKSNLCYQEDNFCITQSDVDEAVNCTLPAIIDGTDPISFIPESCYVLKKINSFSSIYKRSVRRYYKKEKRNKCKNGRKRGKKCRKNRRNRRRNNRKNKKQVRNEAMKKRENRRNRGQKTGGLKQKNKKRCSGKRCRNNNRNNRKLQ